MQSTEIHWMNSLDGTSDGCLVPLNGTDLQFLLFMQIEKKVCHFYSSGFEWIQIPSFTPIAVDPPLSLVDFEASCLLCL